VLDTIREVFLDQIAFQLGENVGRLDLHKIPLFRSYSKIHAFTHIILELCQASIFHNANSEYTLKQVLDT